MPLPCTILQLRANSRHGGRTEQPAQIRGPARRTRRGPGRTPAGRCRGTQPAHASQPRTVLLARRGCGDAADGPSPWGRGDPRPPLGGEGAHVGHVQAAGREVVGEPPRVPAGRLPGAAADHGVRQRAGDTLLGTCGLSLVAVTCVGCLLDWCREFRRYPGARVYEKHIEGPSGAGGRRTGCICRLCAHASRAGGSGWPVPAPSYRVAANPVGRALLPAVLGSCTGLYVAVRGFGGAGAPHGRTPPIAAGHRNRPNLGTRQGRFGPWNAQATASPRVAACLPAFRGMRGTGRR